ncbi:hypothetical protein GCM10011588_48590 [Nocardia jinanensis]|uniref:PPE domain-containing protein n=2 Tax=Nocardia jinanensis TaxID=382504 RepID=A0A917VX56_9NOCA|nr:hypothetical protein [Nocardia jinanensis]GGL28052.1 hypothetical protein GCM10011588_48590 [Nocardia jinanensis]
MFGLPSFDEVIVSLGTLAMRGPLGAMAAGSSDIDSAAQALAAAYGDQSPEAIAARNRIQDLTDNNFDGEFHNPRIPEQMFGNVRSEDLDDLYRKAQTIDVSAMDTLHQMWTARSAKLETGLNEFGPAIGKAIAELWSGVSAAAAAGGIADYVTKAQNLVSGTKIVADKVGIVKSAVEVTKQNVQPAPDTGWASTVAGWVPGPSWKMDSDRISAAELATYSVLERVYQPGIREGDTSQPRIPLAYNPVHDPGTADLGLPGSSTTTGPGGQRPVTSDAGAQSPNTTPSATEQDPGETQTASQTPQEPGITDTPAGLDTTTASTTDPGAALPPGPGSPAATPGSPSTVPGSPVGAAPGGPGNPAAPTPGRTVTGPGPVPGAGRPGAAANAGTATTPGRSGVPGAMMPPGARGKGDDDQEKQKSAIAEALVTQQHGDELTGLDPEHRPKTVPPVLGA